MRQMPRRNRFHIWRSRLYSHRIPTVRMMKKQKLLIAAVWRLALEKCLSCSICKWLNILMICLMLIRLEMLRERIWWMRRCILMSWIILARLLGSRLQHMLRSRMRSPRRLIIRLLHLISLLTPLRLILKESMNWWAAKNNSKALKGFRS